MNIRRVLRNIFFLSVILANVGCDQVSKSMVRENIGYQEVIPIIGDYFIMTNVENSGAFLSMGSDLSPLLKTVILTMIPVLFLLYGVYFLMVQRQINFGLALGISFTVGGGIGNVYDRLLHGSVTDFLHIDYSFMRTGIFNMADISILIGVILIFSSRYLYRGKKQLTPSS